MRQFEDLKSDLLVAAVHQERHAATKKQAAASSKDEAGNPVSSNSVPVLFFKFIFYTSFKAHTLRWEASCHPVVQLVPGPVVEGYLGTNDRRTDLFSAEAAPPESLLLFKFLHSNG